MITEIDDYLDAVVRECKKHGAVLSVSDEELGLPPSWGLLYEFDREGNTPVLLFWGNDPGADDDLYISAKVTYTIPLVPEGAMVETGWFDEGYGDHYVDPETGYDYGPVSEFDVSKDRLKWPINADYYMLQGDEDAYSPMFHRIEGSEDFVCDEIDEDSAVRFVAWLLKL